MTDNPQPASEVLSKAFTELNNWGRWGTDDEVGTLSFITPATRLDAAAAVRHGLAISLAHDLTTAPTAEQPMPAQHHMLASGDSLNSTGPSGYEATRDYVGTDVHGLGTTHLDALCHMFVAGRMYNDRPAAQVTAAGASANSIMATKDGVIGRGVLLDVPAARGVTHLAATDTVSVADLEVAERAAATRIGTGDILIISTGRDARRSAGEFDPFDDGLAGLDPECLPWLHRREIAVLAGDGISDPMPARLDPLWPFPIHQIGITGMGLTLVDNLRLDDLISRCSELQQWTFLVAICPLRIPGGTGSPVNPVAVL